MLVQLVEVFVVVVAIAATSAPVAALVLLVAAGVVVFLPQLLLILGVPLPSALITKDCFALPVVLSRNPSPASRVSSSPDQNDTIVDLYLPKIAANDNFSPF